MEERNFRSYYYEKVGFRVVEEKKSLEILLKDRPVDKTKLTQFALRFPVPAVYRILLWKILLDILPVYLEQHEYVSQQRKEQCEDLSSNLRVLQINGTNQKSHILLYMRALETGRLKLNYHKEVQTRDGQMFLRICEAFSDLTESDSDTYWLAKRFCQLLKSFKSTIPTLVLYTDKILLKQDEQLHRHFVEHNYFETLPLDRWFEMCFANVLPIMALQRIWDKVLGGSSIIMVFLAISLFTRLKQTILKLDSNQTVLDFIKSMPESTAEMIVTETIEAWQSNGNPLTPGSNTDCFKDQNHKQQQHLNSSNKPNSKNSNAHTTQTVVGKNP